MPIQASLGVDDRSNHPVENDQAVLAIGHSLARNDEDRSVELRDSNLVVPPVASPEWPYSRSRPARQGAGSFFAPNRTSMTTRMIRISFIPIGFDSAHLRRREHRDRGQEKIPVDAQEIGSASEMPKPGLD